MKSNDKDINKDKDKGRRKHLENVINEIKGRINWESSPSLGQMKAALESIAMDVSLSQEEQLELRKLIIAIERQEEVIQANNAAKQNDQNDKATKTPEEIKEEREFIQNSIREKEIEVLVLEYYEFKDDFRRMRLEEMDLYERAYKDINSLTPRERERVTGEYTNEAHRKEDEALSKKQYEYSAKVYDIRKKLGESIEYRTKQTKNIDLKLSSKDNPPTEKEVQVLNKMKAEHTTVIKKHEEILKETNFDIDLRKQQFQKLKEYFDKGGVKFAKRLIVDHYKQHYQDYKDEKALDPKSTTLDEFDSIIKASGLTQ